MWALGPAIRPATKLISGRLLGPSSASTPKDCLPKRIYRQNCPQQPLLCFVPRPAPPHPLQLKAAMPDASQVPNRSGAQPTPDSKNLRAPELVYPFHPHTHSVDRSHSSTMSRQYGPMEPEQIRIFPSRSTDSNPSSSRPSPITARSSQSSYHSAASHMQPHALTGGVIPPYPQHIAVFPSGRGGAPAMTHSHSQPNYPRHAAVPQPMVHSYSQPSNPGAHPSHVSYQGHHTTTYRPDARARTSSYASHRDHHAEHHDASREHAYREERYREERAHGRPRTRSLTTAEHRDQASRRVNTLIPNNLSEVGMAPTERLARSHKHLESDHGHSRSQSLRGHSSKHGSSNPGQRVQVVVYDGDYRKSSSARPPASAMSHSPAAHFHSTAPTSSKSSFLSKLFGKRSGAEARPRW